MAEYEQLEELEEVLTNSWVNWKLLETDTGRRILARRILGLEMEEDDESICEYLTDEIRPKIRKIIEEKGLEASSVDWIGLDIDDFKEHRKKYNL
jgi:hypothetical protein